MTQGLLILLAAIDVNKNELKIPQTIPTSNTVASALEIVFGILGAVSFLIIILAGMRYSLSRGNAESVSKSKNAIVYAAVGLALAMMAFGIVRFVVRSV